MWWRRKKTAAPEAKYSPDGAGHPASVPNRNAFMLLGLAGAVIVGFGISSMQSIVAGVFFALVLTICVHPLRTMLEQSGVPRGIATGSAIAAVVLLLGGFGWAFFLAFGQFVTLLPQYREQLRDFANQLGELMASAGFGPQQINEVVSGLNVGNILDFLRGLLGGAVGLTTSIVIVFTMLILMAMDAAVLPTVFKQLSATRPVMVTSMNTFARGVRRYMVVTTVLGAAQGLVNFIALSIIGVPGAALWGMLSFLCSFIPNIGYFIAIVPPLVFAALTGGWGMVIAVLVLYGVINSVIQSVIQPRIVGGAVALSQSLTFFSVLLWSLLIGPMGAILAIPLSLLARAILIDSNPSAWWLRPLVGDFAESKRLMREEDERIKSERKQHKADS